MAQKYMEKGNVERGKKTIVHAFRLLITAAKMVRMQAGTGGGGSQLRMEDFYAAHKYWVEMQKHNREDWAFYDESYRGEFDRLTQSLKDACAEIKDTTKERGGRPTQSPASRGGGRGRGGRGEGRGGGPVRKTAEDVKGQQRPEPVSTSAASEQTDGQATTSTATNTSERSETTQTDSTQQKEGNSRGRGKRRGTRGK